MRAAVRHPVERVQFSTLESPGQSNVHQDLRVHHVDRGDTLSLLLNNIDGSDLTKKSHGLSHLTFCQSKMLHQVGVGHHDPVETDVAVRLEHVVEDHHGMGDLLRDGNPLRANGLVQEVVHLLVVKNNTVLIVLHVLCAAV